MAAQYTKPVSTCVDHHLFAPLVWLNRETDKIRVPASHHLIGYPIAVVTFVLKGFGAAVVTPDRGAGISEGDSLAADLVSIRYIALGAVYFKAVLDPKLGSFTRADCLRRRDNIVSVNFGFACFG